jgi:transglutaminase-like putative cysteine protease
VVYRYGWLAGIAGGLFALGRLERLLRPSTEGLPWEVILLAAAVLGGAITWAGLAYRFSTLTVMIVNLAALLLTVVRITVPATTWFVFPTLGSFPALGRELSYALDVIRTGVAPVLPLAGIIALLAALFWLLSALFSWGLRRDQPYVAVLAPFVAYLQFATMDRRRSGWWTGAFLLLFGLALLAVAADRRRRGAGNLTSGPGRAAVARSRPALAVISLAAVMLVALLSTNALATLLPRTGLLDWRVPSALTGGYYGGISFNPFVGIRQQLLSPTNTAVFFATVKGELPYDRLYFRLLTLESFDGTQWYAHRPAVARPEEVDAWEDPGAAFRGPTASVTQAVTILALQQDWLPAVYSPITLTSDNRAVERGFRAKINDGALHFDALTYYGMAYEVVSEVPVPDITVLVLGDDGAPSPLFAEASAAEDGYEAPAPTDPPPTYELPDRDDFLRLPGEIGAGVAALARRQVAGLATDFEKGLALEAFFRRPGAFRYSTEVEAGHSATDLSAWLIDPESPNYRTGYCEQFATAMAVMARQVGLPSRVVLGFTPGELLDDGRVVIRDRNAHAWVELWMPTQGWVRFDPTPRADGASPAYSDELPFDVAAYLHVEVPPLPSGSGHPPTTEPPIDEPIPEIPPALPPDTGHGGFPQIPAWVVITAGALMLAFGLIPAVKWARRRYRRRALSGGDVSAAWWEIVDRLFDLGAGPAPGATPKEVAAATDRAMAPLARVYGESIYGPSAERSFDSGRVAVATRSLEATEEQLAGRYSWARRAASWYRLRSLDPRRRRMRPPGGRS